MFMHVIKMAQRSLIQTVDCGWLNTIKFIHWGVVFKTCCQVFNASLAHTKYMYYIIMLFRVEHKISYCSHDNMDVWKQDQIVSNSFEIR